MKQQQLVDLKYPMVSWGGTCMSAIANTLAKFQFPALYMGALHQQHSSTHSNDATSQPRDAYKIIQARLYVDITTCCPKEARS